MKQFAIIGMGRFGSSIARTLYSLGNDVLAIDYIEERIQDVSDYVTHAVIADATDEQTLIALGLRNFDTAVVTIGGDIQASILICLLCKEMGIKEVIAKAANELHARVLRKIGVGPSGIPRARYGNAPSTQSRIVQYTGLHRAFERSFTGGDKCSRCMGRQIAQRP